MGYYHIYLKKEASNLFTIILTHGKYPYKLLPMGVSNFLEFFQEEMNEIFRGFEFI